MQFAKQLLARNNEVFAAARNLEGARDLQALGKDASKLHLGQCDTTSVESIRAWIEETAKNTDKLDVSTLPVSEQQCSERHFFEVQAARQKRSKRDCRRSAALCPTEMPLQDALQGRHMDS